MADTEKQTGALADSRVEQMNAGHTGMHDLEHEAELFLDDQKHTHLQKARALVYATGGDKAALAIVQDVIVRANEWLSS